MLNEFGEPFKEVIHQKYMGFMYVKRSVRRVSIHKCTYISHYQYSVKT